MNCNLFCFIQKLLVSLIDGIVCRLGVDGSTSVHSGLRHSAEKVDLGTVGKRRPTEDNKNLLLCCVRRIT